MDAALKLKTMTNCEFVKLLNSGDSAILCALYVVKRLGLKLQIPDQGGWISYKTFPKIFDLEVEELETDYGLIKQCSEAVLVPNPAGYFAEQNLGRIKKQAKLMILDASGSVGKLTGDADIVIGSFGKWKPVNLGYGGFFATNNRDYYNWAKELFSVLKFEGSESQLIEKFDRLVNRYRMFEDHTRRIKNELRDWDIIHRNKKGINVVVKYNTEEEWEQLRQYCLRHGYEYVECPKYIKVNEKAISIEVKRL